MATGLASGVANSILDSLCNATSWTAPAGFYVQLHTGDPGAAGTSNVATETDRVSASMGAAASGAITNDADIDWTNVAATETITHISFWSASSAGTFLGSDALASSASLSAGGNFTIPAGELDINLTPLAA